jgi:threonine 3-dehydrogenase
MRAAGVQVTTRVLLKTGAASGAMELASRALPALQPHEALVRIRRAGICGTDLHIVQWNEWAARSYALPLALGHEFCGEVVELGTAERRFRTGDRVVAETHLPCGHCRQCRTGRGHTCANLKVFSKLGHGCFADFTVVPTALLRLVPDGVSDDIASIMEPFGIAVRAVMESRVAGADVLVTGCGSIGLMIVIVARALGAARVLISDPSAERRALALLLGATIAVDPRAQAVMDVVREATAGAGTAVSIDTSGHGDGIRDALASTETGGTLMLTGLPAGAVPLELARHVVLREVTVKGLYGRCIDATWMQMEALLRTGRIDLIPVLTHSFRLDDYAAAFACAASGRSGKVLLQP